MDIRTDLSKFERMIPDNECFISPIFRISAPAGPFPVVLRIPHCLGEDDDRSKVKVRIIHENATVIEVPKGNAGNLYYKIDVTHRELHTNHFSSVICTYCEEPFPCLRRINSVWFAKFETQIRKIAVSKADTFQNVEIRPYFCSTIYAITDFYKVNIFVFKFNKIKLHNINFG